MLASTHGLSTPADIVIAVVAVASALGAAFAIFRANAAQGLIALMKENIEQLETSRDEAKRRADAAEHETALCNERGNQQEARIRVLERLVTGVDAINDLDSKLDARHESLVKTMADNHREVLRAVAGRST